MSTHWILHMREAWWCDSGMQGSLCILFTFCISSVWRNFHGNSSGNRLFAVSGNIFTHQATEARYTDEVNMFHGKGGGLVVPGTTNPPPSPTSTEQTLTKAELASQTKKKDINMNIEINEKHNNLYNK